MGLADNRDTVAAELSYGKKRALEIATTLALEPRHWGAMSGLGIIMRRLNRDKDAMRMSSSIAVRYSFISVFLL